ncbi:MAG: ABC transporter ATP-binding protein [Oligoflexia bacterium]|nr:ABC transporter ATP-binding protein [Oligoflexia bacterium]
MSEQNSGMQEDVLSARTRYKDLVVRIWPYIAEYKWHLLFVTGLVIVHTIVGRILPNLVGYAVDNVILPKNLELLWKICAVYFSLEVLRLLMVIAETYFFQVLGLKVIYDLRSNVYSHIQKLPIRFFDRTPVGRLVTRVTNDFSSLADLFTAGLVSVFTDSISLIAIVGAMAFISVKLTLVVLAISPVMLWVSIWLSQKARDTLRRLKKRLAMINSFVAENISGMKVIQLYVQENRHIDRFKKLNTDYRDVQLENLKYLAWLNPVLSGFNAITVTVALYYGGMLNDQSAIAVGSLIAFLMHVQDFLSPLRNILEKYQTFQASLASAERIFTVLDEKQERIDGKLMPAKVMGHIEFKNVHFAYTSDVGNVLEEINFSIKPGQSIAIVGATGSGKSTIVSLLQGFYELDTDSGGSILLDGQDVRTVHKHELRRRIGVVQQDYLVFKGTIASNISLNDPLISRERVRQAAIKANCEELISKHAHGLDAEIQERGANLSTGEKQLLSFARVLAFNPDVLILDEATAHIDSQSEMLIQQATKEVTKGRTSIIIAHRLSTILECDRILVLDGGKLAEQGSHDELLASGGIYNKLYNLQLSKQVAH